VLVVLYQVGSVTGLNYRHGKKEKEDHSAKKKRGQLQRRNQAQRKRNGGGGKHSTVRYLDAKEEKRISRLIIERT